jgi:hypothetical protein
MNAKQYRSALARLDLQQDEAARALGIAVRTSNGYANGRSIPEPVARHSYWTILYSGDDASATLARSIRPGSRSVTYSSATMRHP